jgi:tetratricopeptide (TPR) repeat protein
MARAAVKAKQAQAAKAQPAKTAAKRNRRRGHASGGNPNQALFFNRMRRHAKWMYVLLAVLFAITFAAVGVGSGSSGLDQLFNGVFGGGGNSVSSASAEVKKNPVKGWRDLASAYEAKGDNASAIIALQQYLKLRPKDSTAYSELGGLQLTQAQAAVSQYQAATQAQQAAAPGQTFQPGGVFGKAINDPIQAAAAQRASGVTQALYQKAVGAYGQAVATYQQLVKVHPNDPNAQFQLATAAQTAGNYSVAATAYKAYLKLNPTTPQRKQIEKLIKQFGG